VSLASVIRKAAQGNPTGDPKKMAVALIAKLSKPELVQLLADEIAGEQRLLTLSSEKSAFAREFLSRPETVGTEAVAKAFKELAGTRFSLGAGLQVEWMEATVEDHRARIAYLAKLRNGIDETISRHQAAIDAIEEAGVSCLREIAQAA